VSEPAPSAPAALPPLPAPAELALLLQEAQRGTADLGQLQVSELTRALRERLAGDEPVDDDELAGWLVGLARLLRLKAGRELAGDEPPPPPPEPAADEDAGVAEARLAEARLFRAAADVLISDPAAGPQAFLRVLGVAVEPQVELRVPAEALARALRTVLERLPASLTVASVPLAHSVAAKVAELRARLAAASPLAFAACFAAARDRMEAIAYFLALLELVASGGARCAQERPGGAIVVERG